jgi:predicted GNAT family N-acyltransferase
MIHFKTTSTTVELNQILALQQENLPEAISEEEQIIEGFVTVHHTFDLLKRMNDVCAHIIAIYKGEVVGYSLCMHPKFGDEIEVLQPMFAEIKNVIPEGDCYIVMGQICIEKGYRRQGVFRKLYETMLQEIQPQFKSIITEVDLKNSRSLQAHYAVGFQLLSTYHSGGQDWALISLS